MCTFGTFHVVILNYSFDFWLVYLFSGAGGSRFQARALQNTGFALGQGQGHSGYIPVVRPDTPPHDFPCLDDSRELYGWEMKALGIAPESKSFCHPLPTPVLQADI